MKGNSFVDTVRVELSAGNGGNGRASFRREKYVPLGGPDGGDGGRGGHIIFAVNANVDSLIELFFRPIRHAEAGGDGGHKKLHGRNGQDLILSVPRGTVVRDEATGELIGELTELDSTLVVVQGGKGGLGNCHWKTSTHQAPEEFTEGVEGEHRIVRLDLKLVADVGLIGFPNAGKSTLLSMITNARPKIGAYPFTTLHPIMGTLQYDRDTREELKIVDIPGLIKGAHTGAGLGHRFLRHVERTRFLVYVIDMAGSEGRNPTDDYRTLRDELKCHDPALVKRPSLIVANKMDLPDAAAHLKEFIRSTRKHPIPLSALQREGLAPLLDLLRREVKTQTPAPPTNP